MDLADEVLDHLLRDFEVSDHAVAQRPDCFDRARCSPQHPFGFVANSQDLVSPALVADSDNGRFVQHYASVGHIDQRVGGAKVDRQVLTQQAEKGGKHRASQKL